MAEMLSRMKNLLIDVLLEKSLPDASKIKLKDCISMIEKFSSFFSKNSKKDRQVKSELPDALNKKLKTSRSTSDISTASWVSKFRRCLSYFVKYIFMLSKYLL